MKRLFLYTLTCTTLILSIHACAWRQSATVGERKAETALAERDTSAAIRHFESVVGRKGISPRSYEELGRLYRAKNTIFGRLLSQRTLERGRLKYPEDPGIIYELGLTYAEQGYHREAANCFRRAIAHDYNHCDAHFQLGLYWFDKWKHVIPYWDYLAEARAEFKRTRDCDPARIDAHEKLVFAAWALDQEPNAKKWRDEMIALHPQAPEANLLAGAMAYKKARYDSCKTHFDLAIQHMDEEEREAYLDIAMLLPDSDEKMLYKEASIEKKATFRRIYWIQRDPDPTTTSNERELEHIYRKYLAECYLAHDRPPMRGWETERGQVLVKFGWPTDIETSLGGGLRGRQETWQYADGRHFMQIVFEDQFLNGNYIIPISPWVDASVLYVDPPQSTYRPESEVIPAFLDVVAFRNDDFSSMVYTCVALDVDSMDAFVDLREAGSIVERISFFGEEWDHRSTVVDSMNPQRFVEHRRAGRKWFHRVREHQVPFDDHNLALCIEDVDRHSRAVMRSSAQTLRLLSDSLTVSDILLYRDMPQNRTDDVLMRGGRTFYPNPKARYASTELLRIYVEIYNIETTGLTQEYDMIYLIFEASETKSRVARFFGGLKKLAGFESSPDPVISQTFSRSSPRGRAEELLAIDIDSLRPGKYVLRVAVHDRWTGAVAYRTKGFWKITDTASTRN
ncbi:MAG: GWxTD domain-containing protein [bacterium]|nr:GWxTD domain-containing protein [bacterium]